MAITVITVVRIILFASVPILLCLLSPRRSLLGEDRCRPGGLGRVQTTLFRTAGRGGSLLGRCLSSSLPSSQVHDREFRDLARMDRDRDRKDIRITEAVREILLPSVVRTVLLLLLTITVVIIIIINAIMGMTIHVMMIIEVRIDVGVCLLSWQRCDGRWEWIHPCVQRIREETESGAGDLKPTAEIHDRQDERDSRQNPVTTKREGNQREKGKRRKE